jgi:cation diffusion facilitator family transporter
MQNNQKEKVILFVSAVNAAVNVILAIIKIIIGKIGYSQALIADGVHSFSDLVGDALVYVAARASIQHPDKEHPYGHQRIETITTIIIGLILFFVAAGLSWDAIMHFMDEAKERPTLPVIIVAIASIIGNEWLFHYSKNQGEKINSNLLISNAWHKRSDVFVSLIVLISVIGGFIGWLWLDAVGAIIIAILIAKVAIEMIWRSTQELIDRGVDEKKLTEITNTINSVPGVLSIHQLRTRLHGNSIFVDLHIIVNPFISVSEGHHIGEQVHQKLIHNVKNLTDVIVHIDPEDDETAHPSLHLPDRETVKKLLQTRWSSLPGYQHIKKMTLHYLNGRLYIELFILKNGTSDHNDTLNLYRNTIADITYIESVVIHWMP